jgi:hypothetical protein
MSKESTESAETCGTPDKWMDAGCPACSVPIDTIFGWIEIRFDGGFASDEDSADRLAPRPNHEPLS